jgi:galacturan 1,4-alpha-galacturonidase
MREAGKLTFGWYQDKDNTFYRPILFYTENLTRIDISNINFIDSPAWFTFFVNTKDINVDQSTFVAKSTGARPKNSDGFDTYNVDGMRITNCRLDVDDDCVSPKPNTTNLLVENVYCKGSHGISMGSIGQYPGVKDYISNVIVRNVTMVDGTIGVRLKAWAGEGVGYGYMRNITYQDIAIENTDEPIVLDQCYFNIKAEDCQNFPSKVDLSDIHFINITGTSSGKMKNVVGSLKCSPEAECTNIELRDINLSSKSNASEKGVIKCEGIKGMEPGSCLDSSTNNTGSTNGTKKEEKKDAKKDSKKSGEPKAYLVGQVLLYALPAAMLLSLNW